MKQNSEQRSTYISSEDIDYFNQILGDYDPKGTKNDAQKRFERLVASLRSEQQNLIGNKDPNDFTPNELALFTLKKLIESYKLHQNTYLLFKGTHLRQRGTLTTLEVLDKFVSANKKQGELPSLELINTA